MESEAAMARMEDTSGEMDWLHRIDCLGEDVRGREQPLTFRSAGMSQVNVTEGGSSAGGGGVQQETSIYCLKHMHNAKQLGKQD